MYVVAIATNTKKKLDKPRLLSRHVVRQGGRPSSIRVQKERNKTPPYFFFVFDFDFDFDFLVVQCYGMMMQAKVKMAGSRPVYR